MNILTLALLVASAVTPPADGGERRTGETRSTAPTHPAPAGTGGPYEPVEEVIELPAIVIEGRSRRTWEVGPDPKLERRFGPRARQPVNRIVIRF